MRRTRHLRSGGAIVALVVTALVAACAPATTGAVDPRPAAWAAELTARLQDPAFIESLGSTDEERVHAVQAIRNFIANPSDGFDPAALDAAAASAQRASDSDAAYVKATKDAETAVAAQAAQATATKELVDAPSHDQVVADGPDARPDIDIETAETTAAKEGAADSLAAITARLPEVHAKLASGETSGDPLAQNLAALGYDGSGNISLSGPCTGRTGTRFAPDDSNLRPGTMYTPSQDAWTGLSSQNRPIYSGNVQKRIEGGREQLLVEGHLAGTALTNTYGNNIDIFQAHLFLQLPGRAQPIEWWGSSGTTTADGLEIRFLCYAEDSGLLPNTPITRGYYSIWMPTAGTVGSGRDYAIAEPGYQVRVAVSDSYWLQVPYSFFFGADQHTVHVGPKPLAHHDPAPASVGATLNTGFLTETNGHGDDDLESLARPAITSALESGYSNLDGTNAWAVGGPNYGMLGFHINDANPGSTSMDLSLQPTPSPSGGNDDEYQFVADLDLSNYELKGYINGLILPCYFQFKADAHVRATGTIDINNPNRAFLMPDVSVTLSGVSLHNEFISPVPLICNSLYFFLGRAAEERITRAVNDGLGNLPEMIANTVSQRANAAAQVSATVSMANGNGFVTALPGFNSTCQPYGCNGVHAGDMAMVSTGLEASADFLVTDRKTGQVRRRFPFSYSPSTGQPVSSLIRTHVSPTTGNPFSAAAFIAGDTINQLLRSITEGGIPNRGVLDAAIADGAILNMSPAAAPIFLRQSLSNKTLGLFIPDLRFDKGGFGRYAANLAVGVDVTFDAATNSLQPATIGVSDVAAGLGIFTLRCESLLWSLCVGLPTSLTDLANQLGGSLLPQLTHNTIGQIRVPSVLGLPVYSVELHNLDGNLGVYITLGAAHLGVMLTNTANSAFHFHATPINYPSQPSSYQWTLTDDLTGAVLLTANGTQDISIPIANVPEHGTLSNFPSYSSWPHPTGPPNYTWEIGWVNTCWKARRVRATASATVNSFTAQGSATGFSLNTITVYAPTEAELTC